MRTATFTREDGSQVLLTIYDDGTLTLAERAAPHLMPVSTWGPPLRGELSEPYDYMVTAEQARGILKGFVGL